MLRDCRGRVIVTGMGKSGIIARKIAATFSSTGTPAFFLHPAEAVHGDLGAVQGDDVVVALSHTGETGELLRLLETIRRIGARLIAMTGSPDSTLARAADLVLDCGVDEEACPMNLAPTASTTAALAMGDALAMVLLVEKGFRQEDFASLHPGRRHRQAAAARRVADAHRATPCRRCAPATPMRGVVAEISAKGLGMACVRRRGRPPGRHHHRRRPAAAHGPGRPARAAGVGRHDRRRRRPSGGRCSRCRPWP